MFSHSVLSCSLWLHGLQHARLSCPLLSPRVCNCYLFYNSYFDWSIVDLQYFRCIEKWFIYICANFFQTIFHHRLLQAIEYSSLCYRSLLFVYFIHNSLCLLVPRPRSGVAKRGVTLRPRSGATNWGVTLRLKPEARGSRREELPHTPKPEARGSSQEEQPHARSQGLWPGGPTPCPRSHGCAGAGGPRGAIPRWRSGRVAVRRYPLPR